MDFIEKNIYREKIETLRSKSNQIMRNFGTPYAKTCNMRNFECLLVDLILILFFEVTWTTARFSMAGILNPAKI